MVTATVAADAYRNLRSKTPGFPAAGVAGLSRNQFAVGTRVLGVGGRNDPDHIVLDPGSRFPPVVRRESPRVYPMHVREQLRRAYQAFLSTAG